MVCRFEKESQVGDIVLLRDCKAGWSFQYLEYPDWQRTIKEMKDDCAHFVCGNHYSPCGDFKVKLISKDKSKVCTNGPMTVWQALDRYVGKKK